MSKSDGPSGDMCSNVTMADGTQRSDAPHIWPKIQMPQPPVSIVYLDLNHWIGLAKAFVGHQDKKQRENSNQLVTSGQTDG